MAASGRVVRRRYPDRLCARCTTTDLHDITWTMDTVYREMQRIVTAAIIFVELTLQLVYIIYIPF